MKTETAAGPSYRRVQETIRERILSGEWAPGDQIPTERELEREFNLSRVTVSKGLANLVSEGLLIRRQGQGTFVANRNDEVTGPRLIKYISPISRTGAVPIQHGVLEAMHDVLAENGYETGIDFYRDAAEQVRQLRRDTDAYHAGFLIFYEPGAANLEELQRLRMEGFPFVLLDAHPENIDADYVVTDNIEGARMVVSYLAELGHRDIAYITRPIDRSSLSDRLSGFLKGLVINDLPFSSQSVIKLDFPGEPAITEIDSAIDRIMSSNQPPSALFFGNDDLALEAIECLNRRGIRVPQDISIIGYDNIDQSSSSPVPLTTVVQDFYEMAKNATELLLTRIENRTDQRPAQIRIKPRLIERMSVAKFR